jgi:predicted metal-dependent phosphotriesterase family hydrolase
MDAARQGYYTVYGGRPGLGWLLGGFSEAMRTTGLDDAVWRALFIDGPARLFRFAVPVEGAKA